MGASQTQRLLLCFRFFFSLHCDAATCKIDIMFLYTDAAMDLMGKITAAQMETALLAVLETTNEAFSNSEIPLVFSLVYIAKVSNRDAVSLRIDPCVSMMCG